ACEIEPSKRIVCWGGNDGGMASPPPGAFRQVSAGSNYTCGLLRSGHVRCWGGRVGEGYDAHLNPPRGLFHSVSTGGYYACGLRATGRVICWLAGGGLSSPAGWFAQIDAGES